MDKPRSLLFPQGMSILFVLVIWCCTLTLSSPAFADPLDSWTLRTTQNVNITLTAITYGQGKFVAVGARSPGVLGLIFTSPDGTSWTQQNSQVTDSNSGFYGVAYGNNTFVAVGPAGLIATSPNGTDWTVVSNNGTPATGALYSVTYGNGVFVAVGGSGMIWVSNNGVSWTRITPIVDGQYIQYDNLNSVTYANGIFLAVGTRGLIIYSTDGSEWHLRSFQNSPVSGNLNAVSYGNGRHVTVGDYAILKHSTDNGITWVNRTDPGTIYTLHGVAYGNNTFVAVGDRGTLLTSTTGDIWTPRTSGVDSNTYLYGIVFNSDNGTFVAAGNRNTLIQSGAGSYPLSLAISGKGSVTVSPDNIVCNTVCSPQIAAQSTITLHPEPSMYSLFSTWGSDCNGTGDCQLTMTGSKSVTATFVEDTANRVRIAGQAPVYYSTLTEAYANIQDGGTIQAWAVPITENLVCNINKHLAIQGGFNDTYSGNNGATQLLGTLTIAGGSLTIEHLTIQ